MAKVTLRNVSKVYGGIGKDPAVTAVNRIDLTVRDKELLVLVGPSGCGKSTLLRMIAGLEEISSGELLIDGVLCNDVAPRDRDIAMVFQNYALYPHMTVEENMAFGLKLARTPKADIARRVREASEILGLRDLLGRRPKELSGGQRQRVALGRAIVRKPKVFLLDEPLSNLDAKMRVQMRVEIARLAAELRTTMIYVTHDQVEAMTMGDRIVCMDNGSIQQIGSPMELYDNPVNTFVAGFIGVPPINFLPCSLAADTVRVEGGEGEFRIDRAKLPRPDRSTTNIVTVGIRPEALAVDESGRGLRTQVDFVEQLGCETLLYCHIGPHRLVAKVAPSYSLTRGDIVHLTARESGMHFFDEQPWRPGSRSHDRAAVELTAGQPAVV